MAGHSKWANIKHRKSKEDAKRGQMFTKIARQITVAAREGGADPESNFRLRLAIDSAKQVNMPNDNIERAINRGAGHSDGEDYEEVLYEGYAPGGVALLIEALTDNRNRTAGEVRHRLAKHGGSLGESGCVAWMFHKKGLIVFERATLDPDDLFLAALEAGAEDIVTEEDIIKVVTAPADFMDVKAALGDPFAPLGAELTMIPTTTVGLDEQQQEKLDQLVEYLDELDDVQEIHANYAAETY